MGFRQEHQITFHQQRKSKHVGSLCSPCSAKFTSKIYAVREFIVGKNGRKCFVLEVKILRCVFVLLPVTNKPLHWIHISQKNAEI
jgi:hypothetical protein